MMKRIIALLLALILTVGLLPTVALAADGGETPTTGTGDVKNGYYEATIWKEGPLNQGKLPTGVESVSKTAKPTSNPNEYEVTLEVVLKKTESQEKPGAAATVLVLDHSGSMNGCADCNSSKNGANYYHTRSCKYRGKVTTNQTRMYAATQAVLSFIKTYSGRFDEKGQETTIADLNLGRWVCLVWFNETGGLTGGSKWVDVSNKSGYQTATNTNGWKAHDGTNLDCGLRLADYQLKKDTVAKISKNLKNVIVLSDGEPTYHLSKSWEVGDPLFHYDITIDDTGYYVHGNGGSCDEDTYNTTKSTAATLRNSASVYTVCFGASGNEIKDYDKNGNQKITVGNYLKQKIATQPKSGSNEKFAYDAADADALNTAFAAISKTIVSGLSTGTVKDSLPDGITATGMSGEMTWKLDEDFTAATPETTTENGKTVTTYRYTKTYTVTIDPDDEKLVKTEDGYAPLNGETTLTVTVDGEEKEIPFPIPAGKVTMPSHTVTWKSQDGITTLETDNNVEYNTQPSFDQADPTKADDAQYTYTFVGWATEANRENGTPEANLPAVTDDVTYYAAFSKTPRTYTVTWMPQDGQGNAYETDTSVAYNARPSYDGAEPTKAADAEHTYAFVGWATTPNQTSGSAVVDLPNVTADVTYYAAFSATKQTYTIRFETEAGGTLTGTTECTGLSHGADFPAAPTTTSNVGYYFDGWYKDNTKVTSFPEKVTENATYTAKWLSYNSINLDLTGKIQKTLNSDVALSNERFTINLTLEGAEAASATATATVSAIASGTGYTGTAPFQTASDEFKLTFTAPDTYKYYIAEEDGLRAGMTYDVNKPANGHQLVVVVQENASNHALFFESVTIDGTEVNPSDENDTTPWLTITNNYVEPKETFDLNTLITKKFEAAADSKTIPTGTYEFKAQIVETDSGWNKIDSGATYEGTATLTAGGTADFAFGNDRYLKLAAGDHYYLVSEISDTVSGTTGTISYDNLTYSLKITVGPNGKVTDVEVKNFAVVSSFAAENAVEFKEEDHITFNNTYFEEKDPNECTIDFSKFVKKELTTTGSKTVDEATFIVDAAGSYDGEAIANALTPVETQATTDEDVLNTTLTATIKNIVGGNVYEEPFTGSVTVSKPGHYTFTLTERKGTQSGVTYDESTYQVFVNIKRIGDNLVIRDAKTYLNNEPVELIKLENDAPVTAGYIIFKNTIDTGRDDYIPIIIPTIINKDTGMLNKTDHFAYVIGYPDGTVHPNGQITRAEVATIFFRLLRDEVRDGAFTTSNTYSDVAYGKWYNNPISTMSALGIITGYPDGTFKPNKPITRAEFAAIAARFDETQSGKSATFSDVIGHWAAKEIGIAYYNDWIKGYPDGTFKPDQNITRAEAMTLINRVLERKPESPADLLTNMNKWTDNLDTSKWYYLDVQEATNSHGYTRKTFNYELWRQMLPDPDWSRYER